VLVTLDQLNCKVIGAGQLIHRDIKPDNVALDILQQVRLVDFGTSKLLAEHKEMQSVTDDGSHGTLLFSSPEAMMCKPLAHRTSDLFSLGLLLRFLLECRQKPTWNIDERSPSDK
jgi:serine/threonine protein kinase